MRPHLQDDLGGHVDVVVEAACEVKLLALVQVHVPACVLHAWLRVPAAPAPAPVSYTEM